MDMKPSQFWYCRVIVFIILPFVQCSTYLIIAMTFERFYSIVRPHKAASFNTVKRAKIIISLIFLFNFSYGIPYFFIPMVDFVFRMLLHLLIFRVGYYPSKAFNILSKFLFRKQPLLFCRPSLVLSNRTKDILYKSWNKLLSICHVRSEIQNRFEETVLVYEECKK